VEGADSKHSGLEINIKLRQKKLEKIYPERFLKIINRNFEESYRAFFFKKFYLIQKNVLYKIE